MLYDFVCNTKAAASYTHSLNDFQHPAIL